MTAVAPPHVMFRHVLISSWLVGRLQLYFSSSSLLLLLLAFASGSPGGPLRPVPRHCNWLPSSALGCSECLHCNGTSGGSPSQNWGTGANAIVQDVLRHSMTTLPFTTALPPRFPNIALPRCCLLRAGGRWASGPDLVTPLWAAMRHPWAQPAASTAAGGRSGGLGSSRARQPPLRPARRPPVRMSAALGWQTWANLSGKLGRALVPLEYEQERGAWGAGQDARPCPSCGHAALVTSASPVCNVPDPCHRFMHLASPYVMGHRGKTFVIVIPGEVSASRPPTLSNLRPQPLEPCLSVTPAWPPHAGGAAQGPSRTAAG